MFGFTKKTQYELSDYNTLVQHEDGWLIHSQMSGALLLLDDENKAYYDCLKEKNTKKVPKDFLELLNEKGFFKKFLGEDERIRMEESWNITTNASEYKSLTIVTTDRCNLGCTYCYEAKTEWRMMDEKVQNQLKDFLDVYLTSSPTKGFGVTWFGGEPTLNMQCIENLTEHIRKVCKENDIPWSPYIITNGTTLTQKVVDRLLACDCRNMQITVDGIKDDHDVKRPYLNQMKIEDMQEHQIAQRRKIEPTFGLLPILQPEKPKPIKSSFEDIINNIGTCVKSGIGVSLRVNVDSSNAHNVIKLYELIQEKGWLHKNEQGGIVRVYTHAVFEGCGKTCGRMTMEDHADLELKLNEWTNQHAPESFRKNVKYTGDTCTANMKHQFVVNPGGALLKCWHHATDDSHGIGFITDLSFATQGSGSRDKYNFSPFKDQECNSCHILPICLGGCKVNNKFDKSGYDIKNYEGCMTARWNLPQEIKQLYNTSKNIT